MPEMAQRPSVTSSTLHPQSTPREDDPHKASSIPPWVHANEHDGETPLLNPEASVPNTRHYKPPHHQNLPENRHPPAHYKPGRKWDHLRTAEPPMLSKPIDEHQERWIPFMESGPTPYEEGSRLVGQAWLEDNMPHLSRPWTPTDALLAEGNNGEGQEGWWIFSAERQQRTVSLFWRLLLKNPFMPLVFRLTVFAFSTAALAIAAEIYVTVRRINSDGDAQRCAPRASTYMALAVDSVALPYIGYVTWDEYMSKPLGLRSVAAKVLLLLCDLYFIVFFASNLSLAFDTLYDHRWACYDEEYEIAASTCPNEPGICSKQRSLSGVIFVGLVAWLITFSISVMRVVERLRV